MPWVNIYYHPKAESSTREFEGPSHPTKDEADAAAKHELSYEPQTKLVRQEERAT